MSWDKVSCEKLVGSLRVDPQKEVRALLPTPGPQGTQRKSHDRSTWAAFLGLSRANNAVGAPAALDGFATAGQVEGAPVGRVCPERLVWQVEAAACSKNLPFGNQQVMRVLVTGTAGFVGFHLASRLLERGDEVVGIDSLSDYYDVRLKTDRLTRLLGRSGFQFQRVDVGDRQAMTGVFAAARPQRVAHLAAQVGVRYSVENPHAYVETNVTGFLHVLEGCRESDVQHLVYASSSSVYGANTQMPFSVRHNVDHPISLYAATKKADELMAHSYSHLHKLPTTGLRLFTVYGPWGRPDMAMFRFSEAILQGRPIDVYNYGRMQRDFTYVEDVAEAFVRALDRPAAANPAWSSQTPDPASSAAPYRLYNVGSHQPVDLLKLIRVLEQALGRKAIVNLMPLAAGDVPDTYADVAELERDLGFSPRTTIEEGVGRFAAWYQEYYRVGSRAP